MEWICSSLKEVSLLGHMCISWVSRASKEKHGPKYIEQDAIGLRVFRVSGFRV